MNGLWLDFERPIIELEKKIEELKAAGYDGAKSEIKKLIKKADHLREKIFSNLDRWQRVQLARHPQRPYSLDIISRITDDFIELHGDRNYRDDPSVVAGLAKIDNCRLVIVSQQKGRKTKDKLYRNFGMPHPEGYRKALRVMELAAKFGLPVLSLVDTPGADPGIGAEERGQSRAIAQNLKLMATLPVPVVVVVIGEGGSGGAIAIAVGNRVFMLSNAIYSVISTEGCAAILWRDSSKAPDAAEALKLTAQDLYDFGIIDGIIEEPMGGAHRNWDATAQLIKERVLRAFNELGEFSPEELIQDRVEKFRKMSPEES